MPVTFSGTYTSAIILNTPSRQNPATVSPTGVVTVSSTSSLYPAILGTANYPWTLTNQGTVSSTGPSGIGIELTAGGFVTNGQSGSTTGSVTGQRFGVVIQFNPGTVVNFGSIATTGSQGNGIFLGGGGTVRNFGSIQVANGGSAGFGVLLESGGTLFNGSTAVTSAAITATGSGISTNAATATITNYGTISATYSAGSGVFLGAGGSVNNLGKIQDTGTNAIGINLSTGGAVTNGSTANTTALISGVATGVAGFSATASTVVNYGTIQATGTPVTGTMTFVSGVGLGGVGTVRNSGTIQSLGTSGAGVSFGASTVTGGATVTNSGLISGPSDGVSLNVYGGSISNTGQIVATGSNGAGVFFGFGTNANTGTVSNLGTIRATGTSSTGVNLSAGGYLFNGSTTVTTALISGAGNGVGSFGTLAASIVNYATIQATGTVSTTNSFVSAVGLGDVATVRNFGTIKSLATFGAGVNFFSSPAISNSATLTNSGLISGPTNAVSMNANGGSLVNSGTLLATGSRSNTVNFGTSGSSANIGTLRNTGTITNTGTDGIGISLPAGGTVVNGTSGSSTGVISGSLSGVSSSSGGFAATVANYGTIIGTGALASGTFASSGMSLGTGGSVRNLGTIQGFGTNSGGLFFGVSGTASTPGILTNGRSGSTAGLISGYRSGVGVNSGVGTIVNYGTIAGTGTNTTGSGINLTAGGTVTNSGMISNAGTNGSGINVGSGGTVTNNAPGLITGYHLGVFGGTAGTPTTISNFGTIQSTQTGAPGGLVGEAILLQSGGTILNNGSIAAVNGSGVNISGTTGTLTNFGKITNSGNVTAPAAFLSTGGTITNGSATSHGALISGGGGAVVHGGGSIVNFGTIASSSTNAVVADDGGTVSNYGLILSTTTTNSTVYLNAAGRVTNFATIANTATTSHSLINLNAGGVVNNYGTMSQAGSPTMSGTIVGYAGIVSSPNAIGTVNNQGSILASAALNGINLSSGGTILNGTNGSPSSLINSVNNNAIYVGGSFGTPIAGALGTVVNAGTISVSGTHSAIVFAAGGTVTNSGLISSVSSAIFARNTAATVINTGSVQSGGTSSAVYLAAGGSATNLGTITSNRNGVDIRAAAAAVVNAGTIFSNAPASGTLGVGVYLTGGGTLTNNAGALIQANHTGVSLRVTPGTVLNYGTVTSLSTNPTSGVGVYLHVGGTLTNGQPSNPGLATSGSGGSAATISATNAAVMIGDTAASTNSGLLTNFGSVGGALGVGVGSGDTGNDTVVNFGAITGTAGTAVSFGAGNDLLVDEPGAVFQGIVDGGGGSNTIELAAGSSIGTLAGFNTNFVNFAGFKVDPGATWQVSDASAAPPSVTNDGVLIVPNSSTLVFGTTSEDAGASGLIDVGGSALAEFAGSVDSGQTVQFLDATGSIKLDNPGQFAATIAGFQTGDRVDLAGITATSAVYSNGTVTVMNGATAVASLLVSGNYGQNAFAVTTDNQGGTLLTVSANVAATTITFDDLSGSDTPIPSPYMGLTWNNFYYENASSAQNQFGYNGYTNGTVTQPNVAFNGFGSPASFSAAGTFTLTSFYLTAAFADNLNVTVTGLFNGTQEFQTNFSVSPNGPALETLNWQGINQVDFTSSGGSTDPRIGVVGTQFVIDNLSLNGAGGTSAPPVIAAPSSATVAFGQPTAIGGVSVSESGSVNGETFTVTLADTYGELSASGSGVSGSGTGSLTIAGSLAQVNSDLATLTDTATSTATDTITINASDSFGNTAIPAQIAVTVTRPASLFDFVYAYNSGSDYYYGTVADNGSFGYQAGEQIATAAGKYTIYNQESGTTSETAGTVVVTYYSHGGPGQASYLPIATSQGLPDGTAGLGSERDSISGIDGQAHPFTSATPAVFAKDQLFGFTYTYANGLGYYSGTVADDGRYGYAGLAGSSSPYLTVSDRSGNVVGSYYVFAEGSTPLPAGSVVIADYRSNTSGTTYAAAHPGNALTDGTAGLGSETGYFTAGGIVYSFADTQSPVDPTLPISELFPASVLQLPSAGGSRSIGDGDFGGDNTVFVVANGPGNTVSAADSGASAGKTLVFEAGSGPDTFTGGYENDQVYVAASAVGLDQLHGGSGTNFLNLTGSGSAGLAGIGGFGTVSLFGSGEAVSLDSGNFAGLGALFVVDNAGGNTIYASADTSGSTLVALLAGGDDTFTGGFETDVVYVAAAGLAGGQLQGGSGTNYLNLTGAGGADLSQTGGFGIVSLWGAGEAIRLATGSFAGLGQMLLVDNAGGNTIDASADLSGKTLTAVVTGGDSFTGGFETDQLFASPAALASDTLRGGGGTNYLNLTGPGAASLAGVSGFGNIGLAAGGNAVSLSDANFAGLTGPVLTVTAASGGNVIDGSAIEDFAHALVLVGGSGSDTMSGGAGNDRIFFGSGADTASGGGGSNTFAWSTASALAQTQTVTDFKPGAGGDTLDLSALVPSFDGVAGHYVALDDTGAGTQVYFDPSGQGNFAATPIAVLQGDHGLAPTQLLAQHNLLL